MPTAKNIICASCGASSSAEVASGLFKCSYCKSVLIIDTPPIVESPKADLGFDDEVPIYTEEIVPILSVGANRFRSILDSDSGWLRVTQDKLVFVAHRFNFNTEKSVFPIKDITSIRKDQAALGLAKLIVVDMSDGNSYKFVTWKRDKIIQKIEELKNNVGSSSSDSATIKHRDETGTASATDRLKELKSLFDDGVITEEVLRPNQCQGFWGLIIS